MTLEKLKKLMKETKDFRDRLSGAVVDFVNPKNNKSTLKLFLSIRRAIEFYEKCPKPKKLTVSIQARDGRWVSTDIE